MIFYVVRGIDNGDRDDVWPQDQVWISPDFDVTMLIQDSNDDWTPDVAKFRTLAVCYTGFVETTGIKVGSGEYVEIILLTPDEMSDELENAHWEAEQGDDL